MLLRMRNWVAGLALLLASLSGFAQTSTITAQVIDSDAVAWQSINGFSAPYTITLMNTSTGKPVPQGNAFRADTGATVTVAYTGNMDGTGSLSVVLDNTSNITPMATQWQFKVCPAVSAGKCLTAMLPINGTQSLSAQLSALAVPPRLGGGVGNYAYIDGEVATVPNSSYYNIASQVLRCYGQSWSNCGNSSGSGTVSTVSVATANGVSGLVATPTSTPVITLTLGDINPSSIGSTTPAPAYFSILNLPAITGSSQCLQVNASGVVSGSGGPCANGGTTFASLTNGTNNQAAMVVGAGASLSAASTGSITATAMPWSGLTGVPSTTQVPVQMLTTGGTSGPATLISGILNIPQYTGGGGGGSNNFTVNGVALSSSATVNFLNSPLTNGLNLTFSNPSQGNVQIGFNGALTNAGLANPSMTINSQTCTLGGACNVPFTTNGSANSSQTGLNFAPSTVNAAGYTVTPVNSAGNTVRFEVTGSGGGGGGSSSSVTVFSPIVVQIGKTILLAANQPIVTE
jgi:hypothetical protein